MSENLKNNRFKKGLKLGLISSLIFQAITLLDFLAMATAEFGTRSFAHRFWDVGFPFSMFIGMYAGVSGHWHFLNFILNVIFAVIFSLSLGLVFKYTDNLRNFVKRKFFIFGFLAGIILLIGLTFISYVQNYNGLCFDCMMFFGFPFKFVGYGGFITHTEISLYLLSKNIIIWGVFCFYSGFLTDLLRRKLSVKKLK